MRPGISAHHGMRDFQVPLIIPCWGQRPEQAVAALEEARLILRTVPQPPGFPPGATTVAWFLTYQDTIDGDGGRGSGVQCLDGVDEEGYIYQVRNHFWDASPGKVLVIDNLTLPLRPILVGLAGLHDPGRTWR